MKDVPDDLMPDVGFTDGPNLTKTKTRDGYDSFDTRIKWDDEIKTAEFTQTWGEAFIHFRFGESAIRDMTAASNMLLELPWYGEGNVYFRFSLRGSSAAISRARESCKR